MLAYLLEDSKLADLRFELIQRHHLERIELFKGEDESWKRLECAHVEQRTGLAGKLFTAELQADLIRQQTQQVKDWHREQATSRQALHARQRQEMADLYEQQ